MFIICVITTLDLNYGLEYSRIFGKPRSELWPFAVWMVLQHHGVQIDVAELIKVCRYDDEGTYTIALAVALKKLGFEVSFHSDHDPNISPSERMSYKEAKVLRIPTGPALSYQDIQTETQNGKMVIVYYDTLEGVGNQSLIYSIDQNEICFLIVLSRCRQQFLRINVKQKVFAVRLS